MPTGADDTPTNVPSGDNGTGDTTGNDPADNGSSQDNKETDAISLKSLSLNKNEAVTDMGQSLQLTADPEFSGEKVKLSVKWTSSDTDVATVTDYGFVKAVNPGKCTITVEAGGKKDECHLTVRPKAPENISISYTKKKLVKTGITISWDKTGNDGFRIYRSEKKNSGFKLFTTISSGKATKKKVKALKGSKALYYKITALCRAKDGTVIESEAGGVVCVIDPLKSLSVKQISDSTVRLKAVYSPKTDGVIFYRKRKGEKTSEKIGIVYAADSGRTAVFYDKNPGRGDYEYRARPFILAGKKRIRRNGLWKSITLKG